MPVLRKLKFIHRKSVISLIFTGVVLVILPIIVFGLFKPSESAAVWFDDTFAYRKKITFTHNAALANRRVTVTIDTATLITAGKMQSDCDDSRFTSQNGELLLYQLTGTCNNGSTTYDVIFPTINNGTNVGYFYYGNASVPSQSSDVGSFTSLSPSGGSASIGSEEKTLGPALYLSFDDRENGQTVKDNSPNGYNATLGASTSSGADDPLRRSPEVCFSGPCLEFDGSSDSLNLSTLSSTAQTYTISMWVKTGSSATTFKYLFDTESGRLIFAWNADSSGQIGFNDGSWHFFGAAPNDNKWHQLTLVLDSGSTLATLYIDGKPFGSTSSYSPKNIGSSVRIGAGYDGSGGWYSGSMDEFKLYTYARSANQIQSEYLRGSSPKGLAASMGNSESNFLSQDLTAYWPMDEGGTNSCRDGSSDSCNFTADHGDLAWAGNTASITGKFGNAIDLDGSGDNATTGDTPWHKPASITTAVWAKLDTTNSDDQVIMSKFSGSSGWYLAFDTASMRVRWLIGNGSTTDTFSSNNSITTGTWYHIVATFDVKTGASAIYINGEQNGTSTGGALSTGVTADTEIGSFGGLQRAFDGKIDEVRIYQRSFSPTDVRALYNWAPGPVGYWNFNEKTGQNAYDTSGSNNPLTLGANTSVASDDPAWSTGKFGGAVTLNGSNQFLAATSPTLSLTSRSATAWIKPGTLPAFSWVHFQADNSGTFLYWGVGITSDGKLRYQFLSSGITASIFESTNSVITTNQWQHIATTHTYGSSTDVHLYVNGVEVPGSWTSTSSGYNDPNLNTYQFDIGYDHKSVASYFNGTVDEAKVYNYPRTGGQIVEDMNAGHPVGGSLASQALYLPLDEQQGQTMNNNGFVGSSLNATLGTNSSASSDDPTWKTQENCKINGCLSFDGSNDYALAPHDQSLQLTTSGTISVWAYPTTQKTTAFVGKFSSNQFTTLEYGLFYGADGNNDGKARLYIWSSNSNNEVASTSALPLNTWTHIAATWDGTTMKMYINGKLNASATQTITPYAGTNHITIGADSNAGTNPALWRYFEGKLDEIKIYNTPLTQDQVQTDMNANANINFGVGTNEAAQLTDGAGNPPIGEWKFDEATGQTPLDTSGTGHSTVLGDSASVSSDDPTWTRGKIGGALSYDGIDDHTTISDHSSLTPTSSGFTVSAWVKYNAFESSGSQTRSTIISKTPYNGSGSWEWSLVAANYAASSNPVFSFITTDTLGNTLSLAQDTSVVTTGTWYYVTGTIDSNGATRIYVNGVLKGTGSNAAFPSDTGTTLTVGAEYGSSNRWDTNGIIDHLKIYNYDRTQSQVAYDYNRGAPVGHWQFDECSGTTAYDASGNGNNGTITIGASGTYTSAGNCQSSSSSHAWYGGVAGKLNSSLAFDGTDDYVDLGNSSTLNPTGEMSITAWINLPVLPVSSGIETWVVGRDEAGGRAYAFGVERYEPQAGVAGLDLQINGNATIDSTLATRLNSANTWYHIAATGSPSAGWKIYLDGKEVGSAAWVAPNSVSTNTNIGRRTYSGNNGYFPGLIDDVRMYNYALSASQIRKVMNDNSGARFAPTSGQP